MDNKGYFFRMFSYDHWANRECLIALSAAGKSLEKVLRLLAHSVSAQKLWLERLEHVPQSVSVWPSSTIEDCSRLTDQMSSEWKRYIDHLAPSDFDQEISYRNSKGEPWSSRVEDILIHVLMHSTYHRGQAALEMRAAGFQPAYTDFIHGVRQGWVK